MKILEETNEISFHVQNISINDHSISIRSTKVNSSEIDIADKSYLDGSRYRILLSEPMNTDEDYELDLSFSGHLNTQLQGFYKTYYSDGRSER